MLMKLTPAAAAVAEALLRGKLFQHVTRMIKDCLAFLLLINGGLFFTHKKMFVSVFFLLLLFLESNQLLYQERKINIFKVVVIVYVSFFLPSHSSKTGKTFYARKFCFNLRPISIICFNM